MTASLAGRTILMSGGSRGIGLAIAVRAAADGANVAILAKTDEPHPKLEGTVHTAADQIRAAGGQALGIRRARVVGPMLPGIVSLWQPMTGPAVGIPYVVFAGNVGAADSLARVVRTLAD